ncbi:hypothetical protein [Gilliamella sp. ESL0250]|uniref:hypothetical protein n=1 Tax=Gilliamella sp. ESL0250 TaxID=2705036 RepID=UPI00157FE1AA|nr:hypothetical protein [Gilliamella sp. ESL0250]NUF50326.1 hypothetical protein [Gilliamella sp. ESL0250]
MAIRNNTVSPTFGQNKIFTFLTVNTLPRLQRIQVRAKNEAEARAMYAKVGVELILIIRQMEVVA